MRKIKTANRIKAAQENTQYPYSANRPEPSQEELAQFVQQVIADPNHKARKNLAQLNGQPVYLDDVDMHVADGPHDFADSYIQSAWVIFPDGTSRELTDEELEALDQQNEGLTYDYASTWHQ